MKALIFKDKVIQIEVEEFPVSSEMRWLDCDDAAEVGDVVSGDVISKPVVPEKTLDEIKSEFQNIISSKLNSVASEKSYESTLSCASYASSSNLTWKAEADAFIAWRDDVWEYAYAALNAVNQGGAIPTVEEFTAGIPAMVWPQ